MFVSVWHDRVLMTDLHIEDGDSEAARGAAAWMGPG